ncbi:uncharacterized protein [Rutidosis leptorrhynchoides]|uniref:uncharacterized protein n=1 Tax=Rutidosis leptorrhynchoides TaxID=125765 RepID=UPI003A99D756
MNAVGFGAKWIKWILSCLNSTSISVLINGSPIYQFFPKRGVRQGDPLSPFLFILAVEGLNQLLKNATKKKLINGVEVGNDKVVVSHLQYADDTIFWKMEQNRAKWWWRFLLGENVLLVRIIKSIYGNGGGLECTPPLPENKMKKLSGRTWFNIIEIENTLTKLGCNLSNSFVKDVGIGTDTRFWIDKWLGDVPLKDAFPRLFRLETTKDVYIANRNIVASTSLDLTWDWTAEPSSSSISQLLNSLIAERFLSPSHPAQPTDLNPIIPQEIGIFVWRAKQNKLPVRMAIDKKGIDLHSLRCPFFDDDIETLHHTLLTCSFAKDIWDRIRKWWKIGHLPPSNVSEIAKCSNPPLSSYLGITIWQAVV